MTERSALYVGSVMHRRIQPRMHHFRYSAFWFLLDLDEIDALSGKLRLFSHNRPNIFSFHDSDHGDGSATPLRIQVDRQLAEAGVDLAGGRIQLLCMPRTLGHCFNPLSILFCYRADASLAAVIYQVHNTFGERHSYVIPVDGGNDAHHQRCRKLFYVSPFLDMDMRYDFRITGPDERVTVGIRVSSASKPMLNAVLTGAHEALTDRNLLLISLKMPAITLKVIVAIHWEALKLWIKGIGLRRRPAPPEGLSTVVTSNAVLSD